MSYNSFCVADMNDDESAELRQTLTKFKNVPWKGAGGIAEQGKIRAEEMFRRASEPSAAKMRFVPPPENWNLRTEVGEVFHPFPKTADSMNEALLDESNGNGDSYTGLGFWLQGMSSAFQHDSDWLSKTSAIVGFSPILGPLMGIVDGAVHHDAEETVMSALGLLLLLAGEAVPGLGEGLDLAFVVYAEGKQLYEELKDLVTGGTEVDKLRKARHDAWEKALWRACVVGTEDGKVPPIIDAMEEGWRRTEQGLLVSFAVTLAMIDLKADRVKKNGKNNLTDDAKKAVDAAVVQTKARMWDQLGLLLTRAAADYQAQMQVALQQLLTNQRSYDSFNTAFLDAYAQQVFKKNLAECQKENEQGGRQPVDCDAVAKTVRDLVYTNWKQLDHTVPVDLHEDFYSLFDRHGDKDRNLSVLPDGKFFPRVLPAQAFPAPHITEIDCPPSDSGQGVDELDSVTAHWEAPKTLPRALMDKSIIEFRCYFENGSVWNTAKSSATSGKLTFQDGRSPRWGSAWFGAPDLTKRFPPPSDKNLPIDQPRWSTETQYGYTYLPEWSKGDWSKDFWSPNLSKVPVNGGYGPFVGDYVIVSDQNGMAVGVNSSVAEAGAEVMLQPMSGTDSQTWAVGFDQNSTEVSGGRMAGWGPSAVLSVLSRDRDAPVNDFGLEPNSDGDHMVLGQTTGAASWRLELAPDNGFVFRDAPLQKLLTAADDDTKLRLAAAEPSATGVRSGVRWWPTPATKALNPGSYYVIVHEHTGLVIDVTGSGDGLALANPLSLTQVFRLSSRLAGQPGDVVGARPGAWFMINPFTRQPLEPTGMPPGSVPGKWQVRPLWGDATQLLWTDAISEQALDVLGSTRAPGAQLALAASDTNSTTQRWLLREVAPNVAGAEITWSIALAGTGLAAGIDTSNGVTGPMPLLLRKPAPETPWWIIKGSDSHQDDDDDVFTIETEYGAMMSALGEGGVCGQPWGKGDSQAQKWRMCPRPDGLWVVMNAAQRLALSYPYLPSRPLANQSTPLVLANYLAALGQHWAVAPLGFPQKGTN